MYNEDPAFEDELRLALRRVEPPPGFAEEVLGRIGRGQVQEPAQLQSASRAFRANIPSAAAGARVARLLRFDALGPARVAGLAAALLFVLLLPLIGYLHQRHQQEQAQAAAQQFSLAMRLTHEALEDAGAQMAAHRHSRTD